MMLPLPTHDQNQSHRPRGARGGASCDLGSAHGVQTCRDGRPLGFRPLFDVSSPYLASLRARPFSHSSLRVPSRAKAAVLFPSRQMSSRHKFSGRRLSAVHSARLFAGFIPQGEIPCTDPRHQLASNLTDGSRAFHPQSRLSSWVRPDVDQPSERIPQGAEQISQGHGNV